MICVIRHARKIVPLQGERAHSLYFFVCTNTRLRNEQDGGGGEKRQKNNNRPINLKQGYNIIIVLNILTH